jgi:predicted XRE-type DNA-binding protein
MEVKDRKSNVGNSSVVKSTELERENIIVSGGSVFKDLGILDDEFSEHKVKLCSELVERLEIYPTQREKADALGVDQSTISLLCNFRVQGFTLERLMRYASCVGLTTVVTTKTQGVSTSGNKSVSRTSRRERQGTSVAGERRRVA